MQIYQDKIKLDNAHFNESAYIHYTAEYHDLESGESYGILTKVELQLGMSRFDVSSDSDIREAVKDSEFLFDTLEQAQFYDKATNECYGVA